MHLYRYATLLYVDLVIASADGSGRNGRCEMTVSTSLAGAGKLLRRSRGLSRSLIIRGSPVCIRTSSTEFRFVDEDAFTLGVKGWPEWKKEEGGARTFSQVVGESRARLARPLVFERPSGNSARCTRVQIEVPKTRCILLAS